MRLEQADPGRQTTPSPHAAKDVLGPENDYGRAHISGMQGHIRWESLLHEDGLEGWEAGDSPWTPTAWSRDENTVVANVTRGDQARLLQGNTNWMHYEL